MCALTRVPATLSRVCREQARNLDQGAAAPQRPGRFPSYFFGGRTQRGVKPSLPGLPDDHFTFWGYERLSVLQGSEKEARSGGLDTDRQALGVLSPAKAPG